RIERYQLKDRGASLADERKPFVQGGQEFRPVGLAVAPDGSLFVSDWVRRDYELHGQGAIWHVHQPQRSKPSRPTDPHQALHCAHRPWREAAARRLAADEAGRRHLSSQLASPDERVRATCLTALLDASDERKGTGPLKTPQTKGPVPFLLDAFDLSALAE